MTLNCLAVLQSSYKVLEEPTEASNYKDLLVWESKGFSGKQLSSLLSSLPFPIKPVSE